MSLLRLVECLECICNDYHVLLSLAPWSPEGAKSGGCRKPSVLTQSDLEAPKWQNYVMTSVAVYVRKYHNLEKGKSVASAAIVAVTMPRFSTHSWCKSWPTIWHGGPSWVSYVFRNPYQDAKTAIPWNGPSHSPLIPFLDHFCCSAACLFLHCRLWFLSSPATVRILLDTHLQHSLNLEASSPCLVLAGTIWNRYFLFFYLSI